MRRVVTTGDLNQDAMRPAGLLDTYLAHVAEDVERLGLLQGARDRGCPACGAGGTLEFTRLGFSYHRCGACHSLYVSPVPDEARLARYHAEGNAERFRKEQVLPRTADVRARHALGPRARWVLASTAARLGSGAAFAQFGAQSPEIADLLQHAGTVVPWPDDGHDLQVDAVLAFDALERAADFATALRDCCRRLRPRGLLFVTTLSGDGFEVRMLGPRAAALVPPVHLQLLSRSGWHVALAREQLTLVEYSTPGELDVQAVADVCRRDPALRLPPIVDELVRHEDEQVGRAFQELLQQACLSAHVQLVAEAGDQ